MSEPQDYGCDYGTCPECWDHCMDYLDEQSHAVAGGFLHVYTCRCGHREEQREDFSKPSQVVIPPYNS